MRLICTLASLLGIAGCDVMNMQEIKPGVTTGYEVRDRMGAPNTEWRNADGTVTWEYSRQPEGVECFMITIGSDNVVKAVEQVITPANMARIQPGWTKEQVRRLLGKQRSVENVPAQERGGVGLEDPHRAGSGELLQRSFRHQRGRAPHQQEPQGGAVKKGPVA